MLTRLLCDAIHEMINRKALVIQKKLFLRRRNTRLEEPSTGGRETWLGRTGLSKKVEVCEIRQEQSLSYCHPRTSSLIFCFAYFIPKIFNLSLSYTHTQTSKCSTVSSSFLPLSQWRRWTKMEGASWPPISLMFTTRFCILPHLTINNRRLKQNTFSFFTMVGSWRMMFFLFLGKK